MDVGKRICKCCLTEKEYIYLCLNSQGRATYKDETGSLWHGRVCYACFLKDIKTRAAKTPLSIKVCVTCSKEFEQKHGKQKACCRKCYKSSIYLSEIGRV